VNAKIIECIHLYFKFWKFKQYLQVSLLWMLTSREFSNIFTIIKILKIALRHPPLIKQYDPLFKLLVIWIIRTKSWSKRYSQTFSTYCCKQSKKKKKSIKTWSFMTKKKHLSGNWNYFIHMNINKWQCVIIGKIRNKIQLKKSLKDKTWMIEKVLICWFGITSFEIMFNICLQILYLSKFFIIYFILYKYD